MAALQGVFQIGAGDGRPFGAIFSIIVGSIELADLDPIEAQLAGPFVDQRLDGHGDLVLAGPALRAARRRVCQDRNAAPAHGFRLEDNRSGAAGIAEVPKADIRTIVMHHIEVDSGDPSVRSKTDPDVPLKSRAAGANRIFLIARNAQHDRLAGFLSQICWNGHDRIGPAF
ncbi:hypothetical protein MnTg02_01384 [bacterium MnTg02]|nr:hypothetical protein MnTg02_01384 [bacterium MnTg02]